MGFLKSAFILMLLSTGVGFGAEMVSGIIGPYEYKGNLGYQYSEGVTPVNIVSFEFDSAVAENIVVLYVPEPWSYYLKGNLLLLTEGVLQPGETINIQVSLNKYTQPGEYSLKSSGTTTGGQEITGEGPMMINEMYGLRLVDTFSTWRYPLALATTGAGLLTLYNGMKGSKETQRPVLSEESPDSVLEHLEPYPFGGSGDTAAPKIPPRTGNNSLWLDSDDKFGYMLHVSKPKPELKTGWHVAYFESGKSLGCDTSFQIVEGSEGSDVFVSDAFSLKLEDITGATPEPADPGMSISDDGTVTGSVTDMLIDGEFDLPPGGDAVDGGSTDDSIFQFEYLSPNDDDIKLNDIDDTLMQFRYKVHF